MELSASREFASKLEYLPEIGSTNTFLLEAAQTLGWPDFSVVVTDNQTAGRGRMDRTWVAQPGKALAASVLLRPVGVPLDKYGWFPLLAGLAMRNAVASLLDDDSVKLKWPNDVLVLGEKISGVLSELLPDGKSVVVGAGLNLSQSKEELPIVNATSLKLHGVTGFSLDDILVRYLGGLKRLYEEFLDAAADPAQSGLLDEVLQASATVGKEVQVILPDESSFVGHAAGIDMNGRLLVALNQPTEIRAVAAGDIQHLRQ